jgi:hypothetical protein
MRLQITDFVLLADDEFRVPLGSIPKARQRDLGGYP